MKKLEKKDIAPHFTYELQVIVPDEDGPRIVAAINEESIFIDSGCDYPFEDIKLVLRPMSDILNPIEVNCEKFVPIEVLKKIDLRLNSDLNFDTSHQNEWFYFNDYSKVIQKLIKWRFNVFDLDPKLWININTLK